MDDRARRIPILNHLLLLVIVGLVIYLVVDFGQQVAESQGQQKALRELEAEIAAAKEKTAQLQSDLEYARSDEAAEEYGRLIGWAREGEVPVFVGKALSELPEPAEEGGAEAPEMEAHHRAWWDLFFGER